MQHDLPVVVVGVSGASGSGKSSLCAIVGQQLQRLGHKCVTVCVDHFYDERPMSLYPHVTTSSGHQHVNWEQPDLIRYTDITAALRSQRDGDGDGDGVRVVFVEGFLAFHDAEVLSLMTFRVFVHTCARECRRRRLKRDYGALSDGEAQQRGSVDIAAERAVFEEYFNEVVWPHYVEEHDSLLMHVKSSLDDGHSLPLTVNDVLVVSGHDEPHVMAEVVTKAVLQRLT